MASNFCRPCRLIGLSLITLLFSLSMWPLQAKANEVNADEIIQALKGSKTRSITLPRRDGVAAFERLREIRRTRGPTMQEREELYEASKGLPQIDLLIFFDFDSDEVLPNRMTTLNEVAKALKSNDLRGKSFVIAGHTDQKGAADYNIGLSLRRAEAVKRILAARGINASTLTTIGFGFEKLANKDAPYAAENRRVQFIKWND